MAQTAETQYPHRQLPQPANREGNNGQANARSHKNQATQLLADEHAHLKNVFPLQAKCPTPMRAL
jgi:hypothetical protein